MSKQWWESPAGWLCDNGLFVVVFLLILSFGLSRFSNVSPSEMLPTIAPSPVVSTGVAAESTATPNPVKTLPSPLFTITPVSDKPEFILVFVPVNWGAGQSVFYDSAQEQAGRFINESGIDKYFTIKIVVLEKGLDNVSLGDYELIYDILEFAVQEEPGDRYIGLTDKDLHPEEDENVVGWTNGGMAVVAEYTDDYVIAHELGHTFGLCDEYNYIDWSRQDSEYINGCPNPYPRDCPRIESEEPICEGAPAVDGSNSIMGPAGLHGEYGFNNDSLSHLKRVFETLVNGDFQ